MSSAAGQVLIVEDGEAPHVLAAVRSLARCGWRTGLAVAGPSSRAERSRAVARVHRVPAPQDDPVAFARAVDAAVRAHGYDVVLAADDIELVALSAERDRIACAVPHAPHAAVLRAIDKLDLAEAAAAAGLRSPVTRPATPEALAAVAGPVFVKARLHWHPGVRDAGRHAEAVRCEDAAEAAEAAAAMRAAGREPVLQDPVDGELMALTTVVDQASRPLAWCQQRTLRASLRRTSCRAETVELDRELADRATALLADLGWVGLANLQFLRPAGGEPLLIDLNGRLYGSLALAASAGVHAAALWAGVGAGAAPPAPVTGRPGARFEAFGEDLARARAERRGGLARDLADVARYAALAPQWRDAVRDPGPAAAAVAERVRRRVRPAGGAPDG